MLNCTKLILLCVFIHALQTIVNMCLVCLDLWIKWEYSQVEAEGKHISYGCLFYGEMLFIQEFL